MFYCWASRAHSTFRFYRFPYPAGLPPLRLRVAFGLTGPASLNVQHSNYNTTTRKCFAWEKRPVVQLPQKVLTPLPGCVSKTVSFERQAAGGEIKACGV